MSKIDGLRDWLIDSISQNTGGRYTHRLINEKPASREASVERLFRYVREAHDDALSRYRRLAGVSLDPFADLEDGDPATLYPHQLPLSVLQGAFGEIFAGLVAEHFEPLGEVGWEVPAFLFRSHAVAFQQLEASFQTGDPIKVKALPGRTGDDCLAFCRGPGKRIIRLLYCEAKCTQNHESEMITQAHEKASTSATVSLLELVEILKDRGCSESTSWIEAIRQLRLERNASACERCDLVCYVCGSHPKRNSTWMTTDKPHESYSANRRLEAVEIHLNDVEALIRCVYDRGRWI